MKGKFLARALYLYIRCPSLRPTMATPCTPSRVLLTEDRGQLVERRLEEGEEVARERVLASPEVRPHLEKVAALKRDKGMAGIHDLIDWTLAQVGEGWSGHFNICLWHFHRTRKLCHQSYRS